MLDYEKMFSERAKPLQGSAIRETFKVLAMPGMISFAGGAPAPETFAIKELTEIATDVLTNQGVMALQYGITEGYAPLKEQVRERLNRISSTKEDDELIITTGGQQGIALAAQALVNEGDIVATENPSFIGGLNSYRSFGGNTVGVDMDNDGMDMDKLEELLKTTKIKLLYTIATFQNPTGITMSVDRRKRLIELADKYDFIILEDNPYGELRFSGEPVPTIKSLDNNGRVIYCGSFSKIMSPGLRIGFVSAPKTIGEKMVVCKQTADVHTPVFTQMLASEFLKRYNIDDYIAKSCELYGRKCKLMQDKIAQYFPDCITTTKPEGGLFIWCSSSVDFDSSEVQKAAIARKVAFVPGSGLMPQTGVKTSSFRLNYSNSSEEKIDEGMKILGEVLKEYVTR
ncbi:MAG: PLP-dependent aminotransferase family protein [Eubacteriales bacterium]|nr:PLP-dependent aminotransferase family protein [Eubacteriales bacterium]